MTILIKFTIVSAGDLNEDSVEFLFALYYLEVLCALYYFEFLCALYYLEFLCANIL